MVMDRHFQNSSSHVEFQMYARIASCLLGWSAWRAYPPVDVELVVIKLPLKKAVEKQARVQLSPTPEALLPQRKSWSLYLVHWMMTVALEKHLALYLILLQPHWMTLGEQRARCGRMFPPAHGFGHAEP